MAPPRGVSLELQVASTVISPGESVRLELTLEYSGKQTFAYWTGEPGYELWIEGPTGVVWVWTQWLGSRAQGFTDVERRQVVDPGQILRGEATWEQKDCRDGEIRPSTGTFSARGYWLAATNRRVGWVSDPVELEIR